MHLFKKPVTKNLIDLKDSPLMAYVISSRSMK
jgi:hypothetical protein